MTTTRKQLILKLHHYGAATSPTEAECRALNVADFIAGHIDDLTSNPTDALSLDVLVYKANRQEWLDMLTGYEKAQRDKAPMSYQCALLDTAVQFQLATIRAALHLTESLYGGFVASDADAVLGGLVA
jgi:hypothetical protein